MCPLQDCLDPYQYATDHGSDDYADVKPTAKFIAEFPDGHVPIRHVPYAHRYEELGFEGWADYLLAVTTYFADHHPRRRGLTRSVSNLDVLREQYRSAFARGMKKRARWKRSEGTRRRAFNDRVAFKADGRYIDGDSKTAVIAMLGAGLTFPQISRFVEAPLVEVIDAYRYPNPTDEETAFRWVKAEALLREQNRLTYDDITERTGISHRGLSELRQAVDAKTDSEYQAMLKRVAEHAATGRRDATRIFNDVRAQFPLVAERLTMSVVTKYLRPAHMQRMAQRHGLAQSAGGCTSSEPAA